MCTLILAWRVFGGAPVVVAANRDEGLDRPSLPPRRLDGEPAVVAPLDVQAGGTWIGYNAHGVFAGIANRWTDADLAGERSRGLLVRNALGAESAREAARIVERAVTEREYAGFNLVLADADSAHLLEWDGSLRVRAFDPGVHAVTNVGADGEVSAPSSRPGLGAQQAENAVAVMEALAPAPGESAEAWLNRAGAVLGDHDNGVCIHGDRYGTRSASLIALYDDGRATYEFAPGPPCQTAFEPVNDQV